MGENPPLSAEDIAEITAHRPEHQATAAVDMSQIEWLSCWSS